jgi:hypothetical protein
MRSLLVSGLQANVYTVRVCACAYDRWLTLTETRLLVSVAQGGEVLDEMMLMDIDYVAELESDLL